MAAASFHQKQFLPFVSGAPSIRSLSSSRQQSYVLVTTDCSVAVVQYNVASHEYALQELALESFAAASAEVIASGVIECPGREAFAVAYAENEKLFLNVVATDELLRISKSASAISSGSMRRATSSVNATPVGLSSSIRFELPSAPTTIASVKAASATGGAAELFHGVILFSSGSMLAFGFIDTKTSESALTPTSPPPPCVRLSSEQFANFFPEFAAFSHPVLAVDAVHMPYNSSAGLQSWLVFGCADGFIRVFKGEVQDDCSCGPYETKDFQIDGPVTAVSLFATVNEDVSKQQQQQQYHHQQCNLLVACAIGHAIVYENVFGGDGLTAKSEVLTGSDQFDSIFSGIAADVDLDGHLELLLGTDNQQLLAYKRSVVHSAANKPIVSPRTVDEQSAVSRDVGDGVVDSSSENAADDLIPLSPSEATMVVEELITTAASEEAPSPAELTSGTPPTEQLTEAPLHNAQASVLAAVKDKDAEELREATSTWSQLTKAQWHVEAFGAIYSLAWVDLNHDGVNELLVASATGVYIFEADAQYVLHRLQQMLRLTSPSTSVSEP